jgi:multifunctional methyltransferase subunit TRM112
MKLLTTNFLTCAVKACKSSSLSFPLHYRDATLERTDIDFNPLFMRNILPRVDWEALKTTANELGLAAMVPEKNPVEVNTGADDGEKEMKRTEEGMEVDGQGQNDSLDDLKEAKHKADDEDILRKLHTLLLETSVVEGKLVCGNCGFEYPIKEGVGNFLLPAHLV